MRVTALRYGVVFIIRISLRLVMPAAVAVHAVWRGARLRAASERQADGEAVAAAELRSMRLQSMSLSLIGLALALAVMVLGVLLNTTQWSLR